MNYNIAIMDTPGLFEKTTDKTERNNILIKDTISRNVCSLKFAGCIVCSSFVFKSGILQEDIDSILELNQLFKGADKAFNLLVTRCESKLHKKRSELEGQIRSIPQLEPFFRNPNVKVFFSGALKTDDLDNGAYDSVEMSLRNILAMQVLLYEHIFSSNVGCHVTDLVIYKENEVTVEQLKGEVIRMQGQLAQFKGTEEDKHRIEVAYHQVCEKLTHACRMLDKVTGQNTLAEVDTLLHR